MVLRRAVPPHASRIGPTRRRLLAAAGLAAVGATATALTLHAKAVARASNPTELRIATGPPGAVFRGIGAALADVLADRLPGTSIRLIPTDASIDNLGLLDRREAELGFASMDTVVSGVAAGRPRAVSAVCRLFDSWMQLLVPYDSPIRGLADLAGRPVAAGASGSGTRFTTVRLLGLAGVSARLVTASQDAGATALAAGSVDAFFTFTGVPTPAVRRLASSTRLRLVSLAPFQQRLLSAFGDVYGTATLPSTTYVGLAGGPTVTTPNLLLARPDLPADVVEAVAAAVFGERDRIALDHPEANEINPRTGAATMPIPLHEGAVRYFRSAKPYI